MATPTGNLIGQIEGEMIEVPIDDFVEAMNGRGRLRALVHGYMEAVFLHSSINTACNALHHVNQRCARWLLQSHDRVDGDTFGLKQEFLAVMLGVTRPSVSVAAETLQSAGLITYKRGTLTILDRFALEEAACPCYNRSGGSTSASCRARSVRNVGRGAVARLG